MACACCSCSLAASRSPAATAFWARSRSRASRSYSITSTCCGDAVATEAPRERGRREAELIEVLLERWEERAGRRRAVRDQEWGSELICPASQLDWFFSELSAVSIAVN